MRLAALLLLSLPIWSQGTAVSPAGLPPDVVKSIQDALAKAAVPVAVPPVAGIPVASPSDLPKYVITAGGGYASPGGSFAYTSASALVLPQNTYTTIAQEYTLIKGQVQSCTFAGITKPIYQFSIITIGLTGLGGGCNSTNGTTSAAGSGQGFAYFRWGRLPFGNVVTVMKNTDGSGWKATLGFSWSQ